MLKEGEFYDFDYDNEVLKTEKYDTKRTYKMVNGYFPGMATIAGMPVYFENRDGNKLQFWTFKFNKYVISFGLKNKLSRRSIIYLEINFC